MAGIKDLAHVLQSHGPIELGKRVYTEVNRDNVFTNAAAIAYAWVFAIFPMVIFLMTLVPYLPAHFRAEVPYKIAEVMYQSGMTWSIVDPVQKLAESLLNETSGGLLSFGLVLTLYAASGGMNTTMAALDTALDIEKPRPFWLKRLVAMGLTLFMGGCFVVVLLMLPIGSLATKLLTEHVNILPGWAQALVSSSLITIATVLRYAIGLSVLLTMIGVLYHFGPSSRQRIRFLSPGGLFVVLGWIATGFALRVYFSHSTSYSKTYGTVAGMVIMLMVFYLDAIIILVGAELNHEIIKARYEDPEPEAAA